MLTLVTIPFSHFCEKARWALDHSGVSFREEGHPPGLHRRAVKRVRGAAGSVPVLVLDDATALDDSPLIVRWADGQAPQGRKLLPTQPQARDDALALERHLDVDFAPHVRRLVYFHLLPDRARSLALMRVGTSRLEHSVVRVAFPLLRRVMRSLMRIDEPRAMKSRDKVRAVFDEVGNRLSDGRTYLMGESFGVADIAFAAFAAPLLDPPEHPFRRPSSLTILPGLADESRDLRQTPAGAFALRVYRDRRRAQS
jgi:glutathione S-transferase